MHTESISHGRDGEVARTKRARNLAWVAVACLTIVAASCGSESSTDTVAATTVVDTTSAPTSAVETTSAPTTTAPPPTEAVPSAPTIDFPLELSGHTLGLSGFEPIEGGQIVNIRGGLRAEDGTIAQFKFALVDLRVEGATTECAGETHVGPFTVDTDVKATGTMSIVDWGTIEIVFDHSWTVFPTATSPPTCDEQVGTWSGTEGVPVGMSGTVHRLRVDTFETVILS